jgi:hypothetical protein
LQVSASGGYEPHWSPDGKEIYFLSIAGGGRRALWAATVRPGREGALEVGMPQKLFEYKSNSGQPVFNLFAYVPAAKRRFLVNAYTDSTAPPTINLITNWWKLAVKEQ